ncbi:thioredoxin family protein [Pontibacter chitinilyticus]|uniref:thioredoxin family protein n=1 Tax=Pontibacter chitinilyticus TaxID=2674989 RepID=UPI00321961F2
MTMIVESNDNDLRKLIFKENRVIVKFIDENCAVCKALAPSFSAFAGDPAYQSITFVRMNAKENPVSSKEVRMTGTPFIATYKNGTLLACGVVATEDGLRQLLQQLL